MIQCQQKYFFSVPQERFNFSFWDEISRNLLCVYVTTALYLAAAKVVYIWKFSIFSWNQFVLRVIFLFIFNASFRIKVTLKRNGINLALSSTDLGRFIPLNNHPSSSPSAVVSGCVWPLLRLNLIYGVLVKLCASVLCDQPVTKVQDFNRCLWILWITWITGKSKEWQ